MDEELSRRLMELVHELNTPLGAIHSSTDTIETALRDLQQLTESATQGERVQELFAVLSDSLTTARLACDRINNIVRGVRNSIQIDVHTCIENSLTLAAHELNDRISVIKEYGRLPAIECDPSQISQVFLNILINATQAIEGQGEIRIKSWEEGGTVRIAISDSGRGIPAEFQRRIFDRGYTTKADSQGAGLGLCISRQIVEAHKGRIELNSEVGRGSTFTIVLPVAQSGDERLRMQAR